MRGTGIPSDSANGMSALLSVSESTDSSSGQGIVISEKLVLCLSNKAVVSSVIGNKILMPCWSHRVIMAAINSSVWNLGDG